VTEQTRLVLVNASYLKAPGAVPFIFVLHDTATGTPLSSGG
jgi:hypothetical protein